MTFQLEIDSMMLVIEKCYLLRFLCKCIYIYFTSKRLFFFLYNIKRISLIIKVTSKEKISCTKTCISLLFQIRIPLKSKYRRQLYILRTTFVNFLKFIKCIYLFNLLKKDISKNFYYYYANLYCKIS